MPNYQNSKIYTIRSHQTDQIYVGSTTQPLSKRFNHHKKMNCSSKEVMKYDDVYIELLEEFPCDNKEQLLRREGNHIRANNCVNKLIAGRTRKEWEEDNRDRIINYQKEYRKDNEDKLKQYMEDNKDRIKDREIKNLEKRLQQKKELYINTKNIRTCVCGSNYNYGKKQSREKHYKTKIHTEWQQDFYIRLEEMLA